MCTLLLPPVMVTLLILPFQCHSAKALSHHHNFTALEVIIFPMNTACHLGGFAWFGTMRLHFVGTFPLKDHWHCQGCVFPGTTLVVMLRSRRLLQQSSVT